MSRDTAHFERRGSEGEKLRTADKNAGAASGGRICSGGISADALKVIAMVTMVIDHVGAALFPETEILRLIGRTSFPIYVWLLVMGFVHTGSRKKYMLRMAACALVSEIPFDLAFSGELTLRWQNVYFSLLWGLFLMTVLEKLLDAGNGPDREKRMRARRKAEGMKAGGTVWRAAPALAFFMIAAELLHFDYGCTGPVLAAAFYLYYRTGKPEPAAGFFLFCFSNLFTPVLDLLVSGSIWKGGLENLNVWISACSTALIECCGAAALPLVQRYNGVRKWKRGKAFFYLFYPLHLLILYGIRRLFF